MKCMHLSAWVNGIRIPNSGSLPALLYPLSCAAPTLIFYSVFQFQIELHPRIGRLSHCCIAGAWHFICCVAMPCTAMPCIVVSYISSYLHEPGYCDMLCYVMLFFSSCIC